MKKKLITMLMGISLVMGLAACGGGDDEGGEETAVAGGEKIYNQRCSQCHGEDLSGGMGPDLSAVGSRYTKEQILEIIANGKGGMPKNVVTGDDAEQVADWLAAKK